MKDNFLDFLSNNKLNHQKILLAVSGGVDSMVMLHLFLQSAAAVGIAHCNFQLRGNDALEDEDFVLLQAKKYGVESYAIRFDTKEYAEKKGLSIQMAARELRYNWFKKIQKKYQYDYIATAHHKDDVVETFLLNLLRKTGISGLHGIKNMSKNIIRPLLFADKKEILDYARKHNIAYREDITNADDHYKRNYIRHHIIPEFKKLNPNFTKTLMDSIDIISKQEIVYKKHIDRTIQSFLTDSHTIEIEKIKHFQPLDIYLFEYLHYFGFNHAQVNDIIQCMDTTEERTFVSPTNKLLKTRKTLKIISLYENETKISTIENLDKELFLRAKICMKIKETHPDFSFDKDLSVAYFDLDKITFPLQIRSWQDGDFFYPFGSKGKKKLSNLFSELKFSSLEKQTAKLLCNCNGDILWIIGIRSDNRYRVISSTQKILVLKTE